MDVNTSGSDAGSTDTSNASEATESGDQSEGEAQAQTPAQVQQSLKEKFKFTVDGEDFEEEVDFSDKESIRKRLQMAHAAQKRMGEAKTAKQKAFELAKALETNPEEYLRKLGPKGREAAEKFLLAQINDEMMSPEEKELRELKQYREQTESEKAKAKAAQEQEAAAKIEAKYASDYQNTIIQALEKTGLPKTPALVKQMAKLMKDNLEQGLELTAEDLAAEARNDTTSLLKSIIKDATGEQLIAMFGPEIANKIRKTDLESLRAKQGEVFGSPQPKASLPKSEPKPKGPMTMEQWKADVERRLK